MNEVLRSIVDGISFDRQNDETLIFWMKFFVNRFNDFSPRTERNVRFVILFVKKIELLAVDSSFFGSEKIFFPTFSFDLIFERFVTMFQLNFVGNVFSSSQIEKNF